MVHAGPLPGEAPLIRSVKLKECPELGALTTDTYKFRNVPFSGVTWATKFSVAFPAEGPSNDVYSVVDEFTVVPTVDITCFDMELEPDDAAVISPFALTVILALVKEPTLEFTVARVAVVPDVVMSPVSG